MTGNVCLTASGTAAFGPMRYSTGAWGQTEFQVNLKLGLTSHVGPLTVKDNQCSVTHKNSLVGCCSFMERVRSTQSINCMNAVFKGGSRSVPSGENAMRSVGKRSRNRRLGD